MEVPTDKAVQDVKDAIDQILGDLPGGVDTPIVTRIDVEGQAIMTFAVGSADMSIEELSWFVDDTVKRSLQGKQGVGRIDRYGGADREIRVELDPVKLDSYGDHGGRGERAGARDQRRSGRRAQRYRRQRTGDPHPGRCLDRRKPGRHNHRAAGRSACAAGRSGPGDRHL